MSASPGGTPQRAHTNSGERQRRRARLGIGAVGDLAEAGQFAIFPWFPPYDTDVSGLRWIAVMERLAGQAPRTVVPSHGDVGGPQLLNGRPHLPRAAAR